MQGKTIIEYTLQRQLGVGGMAEVWLAENAIGKKAAVKILLPKFCADEKIVARFENEAKVMVQLDHPNIRQVYHYGSIDGRPCIVMEYLEGDDLKALMKSGRRFTEAELRKWWNQIADALNYTHEQGIVHRDIKPSNIFLDKKGNIKLLDFGIAKIRESLSMTQTGAMMGTLMYMSPEQVRDSKHIDGRSDVYSLAVSFVHLLTGKAPYDSTNSDDYTIRKGIVEIPLDLSAVPADWRDFLEPYLAKQPEDRPALRPFEAPDQITESADEGTIVNEAPKKQEPPRQEPKKTEPKPTPKPKPKQDKPKSKKGLWIGLGLAAVAALAVVFIKVKESIDTERYGITLTEAFDRIQYLTIDSGQDFGFYMDTGKALVLEGFRDDPTIKLLKKTMLRRIKKLDLENFGLNEQDMPAVIGFVEAIYDYQGYETSLNDGSPQQNASCNGHEWVDLGLQSGTLWATCNLGANKPEDYGNYYAWGETQTKATYNWDTYKYANDYYNKQTKYCNNSSYGNNGFTDNLTTLQDSDDPATSWGSGWHTPSKTQWDELLENTTNQWTTQSGVQGRLLTSKKNGQTLFLPAAGYRIGSSLYYAGSLGYYWSSSLYTGSPYRAWYFRFDSDDYYMGSYFRDSGHSVRAVRSGQN